MEVGQGCAHRPGYRVGLTVSLGDTGDALVDADATAADIGHEITEGQRVSRRGPLLGKRAELSLKPPDGGFGGTCRVMGYQPCKAPMPEGVEVARAVDAVVARRVQRGRVPDVVQVGSGDQHLAFHPVSVRDITGGGSDPLGMGPSALEWRQEASGFS